MATKEKTEVFVRESLERLVKGGVVLDVGGGVRFGKWLAPYRSLFDACDYKTFDYDDSTGADVIGDIHAIPLADASVDAVICSSVLEHVKNPFQACSEMKRILRPGGCFFGLIPSTYPYHARPGHYPDYWRIFSDTIPVLFDGFSEIEIRKRGGYFLALSFFVPLQHRVRWVLTPLAEWLDMFFKTEKRSTTAGYYVFAKK